MGKLFGLKLQPNSNENKSKYLFEIVRIAKWIKMNPIWKGFHETCIYILKMTCILPISPVLSILLATLTVFPQMSYWGLLPPTTPATTGPRATPTRRENIWHKNPIFKDGAKIRLAFCQKWLWNYTLAARLNEKNALVGKAFQQIKWRQI